MASSAFTLSGQPCNLETNRSISRGSVSFGFPYPSQWQPTCCRHLSDKTPRGVSGFPQVSPPETTCSVAANLLQSCVPSNNLNSLSVHCRNSFWLSRFDLLSIPRKSLNL